MEVGEGRLGLTARAWGSRGASAFAFLALTCGALARAAGAEPIPTSGNPSSTEAASAGATDIDLGALQAELAASPALDIESDDASLEVYGFTDLVYTFQLGEKANPLYVAYPTFYVGNLNLYLSTEIARGWRSLAEVRFLYLPHGSIRVANGFDPAALREDDSIPDYADVNRPLRWGGIEIERVWLERTFNSLLTVRIGQWLTPYGIWNVDHGSPTIIAVFRPYIIGEGLFPERQTGIETYGSFYVDATQIGYHLTLSNGRGPIDAYQDLDHNKALGVRLFVSNDSLLGSLTLGASGYRGTYSDRPGNPVVFDPVEGLSLSKVLTARYRELALAADLKWEWQGLLVQSELIMNEIAFTDRVRPPAQTLPGQPTGLSADTRSIGYYVLAGYRTPWWNIMPFAVWQDYNNPLRAHVRELQLGVNLRLTPRVVLKGEYIRVRFVNAPVLGRIDYVTTQAAWTF